MLEPAPRCPLCQSPDHDARQCPLRFDLARFLDWLIEQAAPELALLPEPDATRMEETA